jgi:ribosomal protein S18 acetylase RimI-like enzyme
LIIRSFSCGNSGIDQFINRKAARHHKEMRVRLFCAHRLSSASVIGAYALSISVEETNKLLQEDSGHYATKTHFPAIYIHSLAVLERYQSCGLGTVLLMNALERAYLVSENVAVFGVALRSLNDRTTKLYERYGFRKREESQNPLMILPMLSLRDLFESK